MEIRSDYNGQLKSTYVCCFLLLLNHIEFFCPYCISNKTDVETLISYVDFLT
jgi:hypothetical protein